MYLSIKTIFDQNLLNCLGEPGLLVGKIRKTTENSFSGYVEKSASEKKIIKDVFSKGDKVFNSGNFLVHILFKNKNEQHFNNISIKKFILKFR